MFRRLTNDEYRLLTEDQKKKYQKEENEYIEQQQKLDEDELLKLIDNSGYDDHGFQIGYRLDNKTEQDLRLYLAAMRLASNRHQFSNGRGIMLEEKYPYVMIRKVKK